MIDISKKKSDQYSMSSHQPGVIEESKDDFFRKLKYSYTLTSVLLLPFLLVTLNVGI